MMKKKTALTPEQERERELDRMERHFELHLDLAELGVRCCPICLKPTNNAQAQLQGWLDQSGVPG